MFGIDRLESLLIQSPSSAQGLIDSVMDMMKVFTHSDNLKDDLTLCAFKVL